MDLGKEGGYPILYLKQKADLDEITPMAITCKFAPCCAFKYPLSLQCHLFSEKTH